MSSLSNKKKSKQKDDRLFGIGDDMELEEAMKIVEGNPMGCDRCGWYGVTLRKIKYKYCVRWYCSECGKWMR